MADFKKNQEAILDELLVTIRAKRAELVKLQAEINKLLNMKSQYLDDIANSRKDIETLNSQKKDIEGKITEFNADYKKQLNDILSREAAVSLKEKKSDEREEGLNKREDERNKRENKFNEEKIELKRSQAKLEDDKRIQVAFENKNKTERESLDKQKTDFEKIKTDYKDKLKVLVDTKQVEAENNLKKSEELKKILEDRLNSLDKLDILKKANESLQKALNEKIAEQAEKIDELNKAIASARKAKEYYLLKVEQQEAMDNEIEVRRLRVEKLARDKGVLAELKELEKELKK